MSSRRTIWFLLVAVLFGGVSCASPQPAQLDVLVIAPHSDDEAIGCTTVIRRAIAQNRKVGIVVVTAGDAHVKAAAALAGKSADRLVPSDFVSLANLRQLHTLQAMQRIGVEESNILFLGYPDGGLAAMNASTGESYQQPHTGFSATYGLAAPDYHTQVHGQAAPYTREFLLYDLAEIIGARKPTVIYTTDEADTHPDHATTSRYVREAAAAAKFAGKLRTYVVHGDPPPQPPAVRIELSPVELRIKRQIITLYQRGVSPVHDKLADEYARPEEVFWEKTPGANR